MDGVVIQRRPSLSYPAHPRPVDKLRAHLTERERVSRAVSDTSRVEHKINEMYLYKFYTFEKYRSRCGANTCQRPKQGYSTRDTENSSQSQGLGIAV